MGVVYTNNAETTLAAAISSTSATSISVTSSSTFPTLGSGEYFYATIDDGSNNEIVKVTAISGTTWTVVRASDNTTARTFANGSTVQIRMTAALLEDIQDNMQSSNLTVDTFTATSNQTAFTLSESPAAESNLVVFIDGVFQNQAAYTISNNTLTLDTGVVSGRTVTVYVVNPLNIGTPSNDTVTSAKLSGNITMPGTLTVGSHDVAFDSPTFVVDNSNSRVGLGTASPTVPVDIVGETKMSSHLNLSGNLVATGAPFTISNTSNGNNIDIKTTSGGSLVHSVKIHSGGVFEAKQGAVFNEDSNDVDFRVESNNNTHMLFVDGGNDKVGIGTDSPANNFHIHTDSGSEGLTIKSTGNTSNAIIIDANRSSSGGAINQLLGRWNGTDVADIRFIAGSDTTNKDDGEITFHTSSADNLAERMRINSSGNVGIGGNATPAQALEVYRNSSSGSAGGYAGLSLRNDHSSGYMALQFHEGGTLRGDILFQNGVDDMQFRVGGGGTERMRIASDGKVGIGTTSPDAPLHINGSANSEQVIITGNANANRGLSIQTAASGDQQDAGVIFDAQDTEGGANPYFKIKAAGNTIAYLSRGSTDKYPTSGGLGGIGGDGANLHLDGDDSEIRMANNIIHSDNSGNTKFTIRAAYGAVATQAELSLDGGHITFNNGTSFTERMRIDGGSVHIGTTSEANGSTGGASFSADNNDRRNLICATTGTGNLELIEFRNPNGTVGDIKSNGTSTSYNSSSDYRLKENVEYTWDATSRLKQLKPARFNFKTDNKTTLDGFLAHEVSSIVPEAVSGEKDGEKMQGIDQSKLVPLLVKTIQELEARITELEK